MEEIGRVADTVIWTLGLLAFFHILISSSLNNLMMLSAMVL